MEEHWGEPEQEASQVVQAEAPAREYVPLGQVEGATAPEGHRLPARHCTHVLAALLL